MGQTVTLISIFVVCCLSVVQIPLDVRSRHLSRGATLTAFVATTTVIGADSAISGSIERLVTSFALTMSLGGAYFLVNRISQRSLGLGDVLIIFPLTLAVAYQGSERVAYWQLSAAFTGALHAVVMRVWRRESSIPFGPHLLLAALAVLVAGV